MNGRWPENLLPLGFHRVWFWQEMLGQTWVAELQIQLLKVSQDQNLSLSSNGSCAWIKIRFFFFFKFGVLPRLEVKTLSVWTWFGHKWDFSLNIYKFTRWLFFFSLSFSWLSCHCFKKCKIWENSRKNLDSHLSGKLQGLAILGLYFAYKTTAQSLIAADACRWTGTPQAPYPRDLPVTVAIQSLSHARPCNWGQC